MPKSCGARTQRGFSLVEVAVAAAIFSLGLGGMSLLLLLAVQGTIAPRLETLAAVHARSLAELVRLVPDGIGGLPAAGGGTSDCAAGEACPPAAMAATIMESWQAQIERDIPTGRGLLCPDSAPLTTPDGDCDVMAGESVSISWNEADPEAGDTVRRRFAIDLAPR